MNLSPLEISEDDCGTNHGFKIRIMDKAHAKMLANRYFKNENNEWEKTTQERLTPFIGQYLTFRSSITCQTDNFKVCKKCFGDYDIIDRRYIGIHCGVIAERLTQLSMRSFHDSGSATLELKPNIKKFIQKHLIDIQNFEDHCVLIFDDIIDLPEEIKEVPGFMNINNNTISFHFDLGIIENHDVGAVIKSVKEALQTETTNIKPINETYEEFMANILSIGEIYSSFIELMLSILYVNEDNEIIRYQIKQGKPISIDKKYNIKTVHNVLSPVLSLLYEPNIKTIKKYYKNLIEDNKHEISIYERIWLDDM